MRSASSLTSGLPQAFDMQVSDLWIKGTARCEKNAIRVGCVCVTIAVDEQACLH